MSTITGESNTYLSALKYNLIRAYEVVMLDMTREVAMPVYQSLMDNKDTKKFLRVSGKMAREGITGLDVYKEMSQVRNAQGEMEDILVIVFKVSKDTDIDRVVQLIEEEEERG